MVKFRPPIETKALPEAWISATLFLKRCATCSGFEGAPIVAIALT